MHPNPGERSYHIFYQLLAYCREHPTGLPSAQSWCLQPASAYRYLSADGTENATAIDGVDDAANFRATLAALLTIGMDRDEIDRIATLLVAILMLGNVEFENNARDEAQVKASKGRDWLGDAAVLLGVPSEGLCDALTKRTFTTSRDGAITKTISASDAEVARDSLAGFKYECLFTWLVERINDAVRPASSTATPLSPTSSPMGSPRGSPAVSSSSNSSNLNTPRGSMGSVTPTPTTPRARVTSGSHRNTAATPQKFIGILDIYGFEVFDTNGFEQFCINYANEKLQQQFNAQIFKLEQEEYKNEGIEWRDVQFADNSGCIHFIENPMGVIDLLNETTQMKGTTPDAFVTKLNRRPARASYIADNGRGKARADFSITHYAGSVTYDANGFLEKNRNEPPLDFLALVLDQKGARCSNTLVATLCAPFDEVRKQAGAKKKDTVATMFRDSLRDLMTTIGTTQTNYIRCIKPNDNKTPHVYTQQRVLEQLRCGGVMEAIRIAQAGFPNRAMYRQFCTHYRTLALPEHFASITNGMDPTQHANEAQIFQAMQSAARVLVRDASQAFSELRDLDERVQYGKSKIFLKAGVLGRMEEALHVIQARAALVLQAHVRGARVRSRVDTIRHGVVAIQALARRRIAEQQLQTRLRGIVALQALCRARLARGFFREKQQQQLLLQRQHQATVDEEIEAQTRAHKPRASIPRPQPPPQLHDAPMKPDSASAAVGLHDELEELRQRDKELLRLRDALAEEQRKSAHLSAMLSGEKQRAAEAEDEATNTRQQVATLQRRTSEMEIQVEQQQTVAEKKKTKLVAVKAQLQEVVEQKSTLTSHRDATLRDAQARILELERQLIGSQTDTRNLQTKYEQLQRSEQETRAMTNKENAARDAELAEARQELVESELENEALGKRIAALETRVRDADAALIEERRHAFEKLAELESDMVAAENSDALRDDLEEVHHELAIALEKLHTFETAATSKDVQLEAFNEELEDTREALVMAQNEARKWHAEYETLTRDSKEKIEKAATETARTQHDREKTATEMEARCKALQDKLTQISETLAQERANVEKLRHVHAEEIAARDAKVGEYIQKAVDDTYTDCMQTVQADVNKIRTDYEKKLRTFTDRTLDAEDQLLRTRADRTAALHDMEEEINTLRADCARLKTDLESAEQRVEDAVDRANQFDRLLKIEREAHEAQEKRYKEEMTSIRHQIDDMGTQSSEFHGKMKQVLGNELAKKKQRSATASTGVSDAQLEGVLNQMLDAVFVPHKTTEGVLHARDIFFATLAQHEAVATSVSTGHVSATALLVGRWLLTHREHWGSERLFEITRAFHAAVESPSPPPAVLAWLFKSLGALHAVLKRCMVESSGVDELWITMHWPGTTMTNGTEGRDVTISMPPKRVISATLLTETSLAFVTSAARLVWYPAAMARHALRRLVRLFVTTPVAPDIAGITPSGMEERIAVFFDLFRDMMQLLRQHGVPHAASERIMAMYFSVCDSVVFNTLLRCRTSSFAPGSTTALRTVLCLLQTLVGKTSALAHQLALVLTDGVPTMDSLFLYTTQLLDILKCPKRRLEERTMRLDMAPDLSLNQIVAACMLCKQSAQEECSKDTFAVLTGDTEFDAKDEVLLDDVTYEFPTGAAYELDEFALASMAPVPTVLRLLIDALGAIAL